MEQELSLTSPTFSVDVRQLGALKRIAKKIALACAGGEVIYLTGELGAGKTTFVQYLARALGLKSIVNSPTFLVMKEYQGKNLALVHADCYRASGLDDILSTGLLDKIGLENTVCAIEWPEKVAELENYPHLHLTLTLGEKSRVLNIERHGEDEIHTCLWAKVAP